MNAGGSRQDVGPLLDELLGDSTISEIMVNGTSSIYVEKGGKLFLTGKTYVDEKEVYSLIDTILRPFGKHVDDETPYADARLPDGSRVNIIVPPLSLIGPMITIRKFSNKLLSGNNLLSFGSCSENMLEFVRHCVKLKKNIVISGGAGSGKTTLLNIVSSFIEADERILTIEDAAELQLNQAHVGRLETKTPDVITGKPGVTARQLLINALRMRPDRIIVGECRGGEALDMLQAMNTGHAGSMTTLHANSPRDCLKRIEVMVLMAGFDLPVRAIREQVSSAINIVIQLSRIQDGTRKITDISEITGMEGDTIILTPIYEFRQRGFNKAEGKIEGEFQATGTIPALVEELRAKGIDTDMKMFQ